MFGRRKRAQEEPGPDTTTQSEPTSDDDGSPSESADTRPDGPFDSAEDAPEVERLDLGGLRIPAVAEMQVRIEADPATKTVISATVLLESGAVQLQAFAAPRTESLWEQVRDEIAETMRQSGAVDEVDGTFGPELHGQVTVPGPDGKQQQVPAVFAGVDGPRWLLRLVFTGAAVSDAAVRESLDEVVRGTVIDRGTEPMPPRSLIPLTMPGEGNDPWVAPSGGGTTGG